MLATAPAPDAGAGGLAQNENAPGAEAGARVEQSGCSMPPPILRDAALAHAKRGRPVFPCNPSADPEKGKKPLTEHGFKDATTDAEQIKLWWTKWPNALIGMPTGAISKCFVLDVDVDEAKGKNGEESLSKLINGHGALPDTVEAMTPRGGRHIYFKHPGGASIQNSTSKIGKDLDIRGDGGYVILPPSRLENGKQYDWEGSSSPDDGVKAVYAPDWLLELVIEHPKPPQQQEPVADQIEEGKRNDTLFRLGRSLRAKGLGERAILAALREENMAKCCPPLSDDEVRILVGSACTKPPGQALPTDTDSIPLLRGEKRDAWLAPTPLPARGTHGEAPTFPLNLLPEPVQVAAREVARFAKVPEAAPGLVGVSAIATAVGKRAMVEERPGLTHYASMFLGGIAVTGERKSGSFKPMTAPLKDWTEDQGPVWEAATRKAKARNVALDAALTEAKAKAKKGGVGVAERAIEELEAQRLPLPPHPRLFTSDATEQRLFQLMHDRGGCFAVLSGEGRPVIDAIMGKYSGEGRTGDAIYLAGISGDTITRDRVGGEAGPEDRVIHDPCLNVCILVQPDKYLEAARHPALRASGALARIWPVWLPSLVGSRFEEKGEAGLDPQALKPYADLIRTLLNHATPEDDQGRPVPHLARLSPAAAEARREYHNDLEVLMVEGGDLADVRDIAAKAVSQTVKLALVLHLAEHPEALGTKGSEISAETWTVAQAIGVWFLTEAVRVQRLADEDPALEAARRVLRWLATERRKTVTGRELQREGPRPRPNATEAAATLESLADHGYLREASPPGTRKPLYLVHPSLNVANVAGGSL